MKRNRILFFVTILTLTLAIGAMAQVRGRMGGQGVRGGGQQAAIGQFGGHLFLVKYLELTEDQINEWKTIRENARTQAGSLIQARQENRAQIREALERGSSDATAIGQLVIANHAIRTQLQVIHEAAQAQFANILTVEQKEKFEKFLELLKSMPRRGRGGEGFAPGAGMGFGGGFGGGFGPGDGTCPWTED